MKKIMMLCIVAAFATSCKKDYSCVCTSTDKQSNGTIETTVDTYSAKTKKKDAEEWCKAIPKATLVGGGTSVTADDSRTCELK